MGAITTAIVDAFGLVGDAFGPDPEQEPPEDLAFIRGLVNGFAYAGLVYAGAAGLFWLLWTLAR